MAIKRDASGTPTDLTTLKRRLTGAWVDMLAEDRVFRREAGDWEDLLPGAGGGGLIVTTNVPGASAFYLCNDPSTPPLVCPTVASLVTNSITATAVGGTGAGPTYLWEYVSGDMNFSAANPTGATTEFNVNLIRNSDKVAVWKCTATRGADTSSVNVTLDAIYQRTVDGGIEP